MILILFSFVHTVILSSPSKPSHCAASPTVTAFFAMQHDGFDNDKGSEKTMF